MRFLKKIEYEEEHEEESLVVDAGRLLRVESAGAGFERDRF